MDYLNRLEQDNVPETMHDYRPSHFRRPSWLIEAAEAADQEWKRYDETLERELFAPETEIHEPDYRLIENSRLVAEWFSWWYGQCYNRYMKRLRGE